MTERRSLVSCAPTVRAAQPFVKEPFTCQSPSLSWNALTSSPGEKTACAWTWCDEPSASRISSPSTSLKLFDVRPQNSSVSTLMIVATTKSPSPGGGAYSDTSADAIHLEDDTLAVLPASNNGTNRSNVHNGHNTASGVRGGGSRRCFGHCAALTTRRRYLHRNIGSRSWSRLDRWTRRACTMPPRIVEPRLGTLAHST